MAAVLTREEIAAARAAAAERVRARSTREYRTVTEAGRREAWLRGEELRGHDWRRPAVRAPESVSEWIDDRVLEWSQVPRGEGAVLVTVLEAARDGAEAAAAALTAALGLTPAQQWAVRLTLEAWRTADHAGRPGADRLALALLAAWRRLGLPEADPAAAPEPRRRRRRWETQEAAS